MIANFFDLSVAATFVCANLNHVTDVPRSKAYAAFISSCEAFEALPQSSVLEVLGSFLALVAIVDITSRVRRWRQR